MPSRQPRLSQKYKHVVSTGEVGWRHSAELSYSSNRYWTNKNLFQYCIDNALSVSSYSPSFPDVFYVSNNKRTIVMSEKYRVPLMFTLCWQWTKLKSLMTASEAERDRRWPVEKFEVLHIARVCKTLADAGISQEALANAGYAKGKEEQIKKWRYPTLDRVLTRFRMGCFSSECSQVEQFWDKYRETEYVKDVTEFDWMKWISEPRDGITMPPSEFHTGVSAEQFMQGLVIVNDQTWIWETPENPIPNTTPAWSIRQSQGKTQPIKPSPSGQSSSKSLSSASVQRSDTQTPPRVRRAQNPTFSTPVRQPEIMTAPTNSPNLISGLPNPPNSVASEPQSPAQTTFNAQDVDSEQTKSAKRISILTLAHTPSTFLTQAHTPSTYLYHDRNPFLPSPPLSTTSHTPTPSRSTSSVSANANTSESALPSNDPVSRQSNKPMLRVSTFSEIATKPSLSSQLQFHSPAYSTTSFGSSLSSSDLEEAAKTGIPVLSALKRMPEGSFLSAGPLGTSGSDRAVASECVTALPELPTTIPMSSASVPVTVNPTTNPAAAIVNATATSNSSDNQGSTNTTTRTRGLKRPGSPLQKPEVSTKARANVPSWLSHPHHLDPSSRNDAESIARPDKSTPAGSSSASAVASIPTPAPVPTLFTATTTTMNMVSRTAGGRGSVDAKTVGSGSESSSGTGRASETEDPSAKDLPQLPSIWGHSLAHLLG
ncbi:hypothetical protein BDP27DRAFT_1455633 [Rhodocollybia butyracea]|uniref:Uncharacterized protein n=1 Tax=Rhodocollybia butyracea TaxID=206335 RepID=A0A9P5TX69_9AGAR|nr:hypothetical protein BDP27DRAFT_1455633 [Rhodocollybia butyracea]